jgi:hypothetical protein
MIWDNSMILTENLEDIIKSNEIIVTGEWPRIQKKGKWGLVDRKVQHLQEFTACISRISLILSKEFNYVFCMMMKIEKECFHYQCQANGICNEKAMYLLEDRS